MYSKKEYGKRECSCFKLSLVILAGCCESTGYYSNMLINKVAGSPGLLVYTVHALWLMKCSVY